MSIVVVLTTLMRTGLLITNILVLSIWKLRFKHLAVNVTIRTRSHYKPSVCASIDSETSLCPHFAKRILILAKFPRNEISLLWMRNFPWLKIRGRLNEISWRTFMEFFARATDEIRRISLSLLLQSTVVEPHFRLYLMLVKATALHWCPKGVQRGDYSVHLAD